MRPKLPPTLIKFILYQTADILAHLHGQGIVYRDLKLTNIMISSDLLVKIVDFGLSKRIHKTRTKSICGTPHALPPDIHEDDGYTYDIDSHTLGVVACELVLGRPPFDYKLSFDDIKNRDYNAMMQDIQSSTTDKHAADFVTSLLQPHASKRMSLHSAMQHAYLHDIRHLIDSHENTNAIHDIAQSMCKDYAAVCEDIELVECRADDGEEGVMIEF